MPGGGGGSAPDVGYSPSAGLREAARSPSPVFAGPALAGLAAAPFREAANAFSLAAATGKAALIDMPRWYIVGQGLETGTASSSSAAVSSEPLRGVFFHGQRNARGVRPTPTSPGMPPTPHRRHQAQVKAGDFRQCLGLLVASEGNARDIALKLYPRFQGDLERLPDLLQLLEDKWGFPNRVFPLLWTQLRRSLGGSDPKRHVSEQAWVEAFARWLQILWIRSSQTKVSRQCFVHTKAKRDLAKVYFMGALLGEGSYGQVHLALHTGLGMARVVKSVPKSQLEMAVEQVEDEVAALRAMDHPHIVRIFEAFETGDALHIVMDYAEGGDLASVIREEKERGGLPEAYVQIAAGQILSALAYMHSKGVIHCDLKPQNVMLLRKCSPADFREGKDEPHLLLVDFGLSEIFEESPNSNKTKTVKGTPSYLAPEGFDGRLSHKSDAWSFGVVFFEMLSGQRPFRGTNNVFLLFCQIMKEKPPLGELPYNTQDLVGALLTKDPAARMSAEQCLQHAWFQRFFSKQGEDAKVSEGLPQVLEPATSGCASYFYRAAMFCAASALGLKDVQALFEAFQAIDTDKSGYLTRQQLTSGLSRFGVSQDPGAVMALLDLDQDGHISLTEFLAGVLRMEKEVSEPLLRHCFATFDLDGDGFISMPDLQDFLSCGDFGSADMLPDGQTVDQVMEEVSNGEGQISFESFQNFLKRSAASCGKPVAKKVTNMHPDAPTERTAVQEMVDKLETQPTITISESGTSIEPEEPFAEFPSFDRWLEELFRNTQRGAALGWLLVFEDAKMEGSYAGQNFKCSCRRIALLGAGLFLYSIWALTTENDGWWPRWSPSLRRWESSVHIANNVAWLFLATVSVVVLMLCSSLLRKGRLCETQAAQAIRFEHFLCATGCVLPWLCCCLANRSRVSAIFGVRVQDAFESVNSDYDLIVTFVGTLMFITTLTHVRLVSVLPIGVSCVLAYALSSIILGVELSTHGGGSSGENWSWPSVLLLLVLAFNLWGHRTVEKHRRLTFLSLHASYRVLREAQEDSGSGGCSPKVMRTDSSGMDAGVETRYARFKRALDLVRQLSDAMDSHKPLACALHGLLEVLMSLREDIAQADRAHSVDIGAALQHNGLVEGGARELLLDMFDALPASEETAQDEAHRVEVDRLALSLSRTSGGLSMLLDSADMKPGDWGWDLLSGRQENTWPLAEAGEELLLPTVAAAATADWCCGPKQAAAARSRAGLFMDCLARAYARRHGVELRAALAMRSAHWLAHRLGLWVRLDPWERVALLVAAAGLHSGVEGEDRRGCGLMVEHPLLTHAASLDCTLKSLDLSGLTALAAGASDKPVYLRRLVTRLVAHARPRFSLDDAYRVRVQLESDDKFPVTAAERAELSSLVLAAADLAFLALPAAYHEPWALLCQDEARWLLALHRDIRPCSEDKKLDVGQLLRGLIEVLAAPLYETLARVGEAGQHLAAPLRHLRSNFKHWKVAELTALPSPTPVSTAAPSPATSGGFKDSFRFAGRRPSASKEAPLLGRERTLGELPEEPEPQVVEPASALRRLGTPQAVVAEAGDQAQLPGSVASPLHSPRQPLISEANMMRTLSQSLIFVDREDDHRPPAMPIVAEESSVNLSQTIMSVAGRNAHIHEVELPALDDDCKGMAVTATQEFLSRSLSAGGMMLVVVAEPDQPPQRPMSAALDVRPSQRPEAFGGTGRLPLSRQSLRPPTTPPALTLPPLPPRPWPPLSADAGGGGGATAAEPASCSPEPLVAWAADEEASQTTEKCPTMPESPTAGAGSHGGTLLAELDPSVPPQPDRLSRSRSLSASLQKLLENVLSER